jgi:hypothetical protein
LNDVTDGKVWVIVTTSAELMALPMDSEAEWVSDATADTAHMWPDSGVAMGVQVAEGMKDCETRERRERPLANGSRLSVPLERRTANRECIDPTRNITLIFTFCGEVDVDLPNGQGYFPY